MILRTFLRRSPRIASFSSATSASASQPLLLWLGDDGGPGSASKKRRLLIPPSIQSTPHVRHVTTVDDIQAAVTSHYTSDDLDVGGMGEQDAGVWFAAASKDEDVLDASALLRDSIEQIKQERHGVPFGVCTTGLTNNSVDDVASIGLSILNVSLLAASPPDYAAATDGQGNDFGRVCGFIVDAVEKGLAVEVSVLPEYAGAARELGHSLGARDVHIVEMAKETQA